MNKIPIKETLNMWFVIHILPVSFKLHNLSYNWSLPMQSYHLMVSFTIFLSCDAIRGFNVNFRTCFFFFLRQMVYEVSFLLFAFYFSSLFAYRFVVEFLIQEHQQLFICLLMQEHCYLLFRLRSINPSVSLCLILWLYLKCVPLHSL